MSLWVLEHRPVGGGDWEVYDGGSVYGALYTAQHEAAVRNDSGEWEWRAVRVWHIVRLDPEAGQ